MSDILREYVVTLKDKADLEQFYLEMENPGSYGSSPVRSVECVNRRPISRNTHYMLTKAEAEKLKEDFRVEAVELTLESQGLKVIPHGTQTGSFNRSFSIASGQRNWALYRCQLEDNIYGWGSEQGTGSQTTTITLTGSGKNVDVIVCDGTVYPSHGEFGSRVVQYDWFANHNAAVWPANTHTNYTYTAFTQLNNHATQVATTIAGSTQGWARDANIYNIIHDTANLTPGSTGYTDPTIMPTQYLIDYIRAFHNGKSVNPTTKVKNPTVVNNSWGLGYTCNFTNIVTGSGNSRFSKVYFRGAFVTPESLGQTAVDTGFSGVCNATTRLATLSNVINGGNRIVSTGSAAATCSSLTLSIPSTATGYTDLGAPTAYDPGGVDQYDDSFWQVTLPFQITYCGGTYGPGGTGGNYVFVSSNSYLQFGGNGAQAEAWYVGAAAPQVRKILISGGDRSCQKVYTLTSGTTPNRTFKVRYEGHDAANGGVSGSPTILWEATFYEATNNQIDLHIKQNAAYRAEFSSDNLRSLGIMQGGANTAPQRNAALDADITDAIADGIIFVGSSGAGSFKVDSSGGTDYDNYFVDNGLPYYYHRGSSPGASTSTTICVGSTDSTSDEHKHITSNAGPRVDLYAPGSNVIAGIYDASGDSGGADSTTLTENGNLYQKYSGSSIGAAQVTGVLAIVLETYPRMTQAEARTYLINYAKVGKMYATNNGLTDTQSLQGGNNRFLFYYKERPADGNVWPKINYKVRPSSGAVFPRNKIRRTT
jgi:hypothetical protein